MWMIRMGSVLRELSPDQFDFDYTSKVPAASFVFMGIAFVLAIGVPIAAYLYLRRRMAPTGPALLYGLMAYLLGRYFMPTAIDFGLSVLNGATGIFDSAPVVYYMIGAVVTIVLEYGSVRLGIWLTGRKARVSLGAALYFAFGFSIIPILTQTITYLGNYFSISVSINNQNMLSIVEEMIANGSTEEEIRTMLDGIRELIAEPPVYYLMLSLDVLILIPVHVSASCILAGRQNGSVPSEKMPFLWAILLSYGLAVLLRGIIVSKSAVIYVAIYVVVAVIAFVLGKMVVSSCMPDEYEKLVGPPDPDVMNRGGGPGSGPGKSSPAGGQHKMPKIVMPKD